MAGALYFAAIALFGFAVLAALRVPESIWLVACIFPVFIALILGFVMSVFAWSEFGAPLGAGALIVPIAALLLMRPLSARRLFLVICAATAVGLVCARFAFIAAGLG